MKWLVALVLLAALAFAFVLQRNAVTRELAEAKALQARLQELHQLAPDKRDPGSSSQPRSPSELPRLRNQVRQLREKLPEVERLRASNQRLAAEIRSGQITPRRLSDMEGAVPREKWAPAGFGTPEASLQTFFTALASGDAEQILRCVPPHREKQMRQQMAEDPEWFRREFLGGVDQFSRLTAYRITSVSVEDSRAVVEVQLTAGGKPIPFIMWEEDDREWKLSP